MFEIGDIVEVIRDGQTYSIYKKLAKRLDAKNWMMGNGCNNGEIGVILNIGKHSEERPILVALVSFNNMSKDVLIGIDGIKRIRKERDLFGQLI
jgi:hypothetical protein